MAESVAKIARAMYRETHWIKTPAGPRHVKEPLRASHLEAHINNQKAVGLAPIAPGESSTRIALIDLDSHKGEATWDDMAAIGQRVMDVLRAAGMSPFAFRSSGGKGIHLYLLWNELQDAYSVREFLRQAISQCGLKNGTKGVKAGDAEIFPKQDSVASDGFGSMWILPLTGESLPLDKATLEIKGYDYAEYTDWPKSQPVPKCERPTVERSPQPVSTDLSELKAALDAIPNNGALDYDGWRDVIFAIHHATGGSEEGRTLAHEFSKRSAKYDAAFLDERVWPYIKGDERGGKVITAATLFAKAREHGWQENVLDDFEDLGPAANDPAPAIVAPGSVAKRFRVTPSREFLSRPSPKWIIKGLLPQSALAVVYGTPGSGKSLWTLDVMATVAQGAQWRGRRVQRLRSVYVAAEDPGGSRDRFDAWGRHKNVSDLDIGVIDDCPNLILKDDARELEAAIRMCGHVGLIVIDTLAQASAGADENSAQDMGRVIANCKAIHQATGALVVLVHHAGKDPTKGARGWSGLFGAVDAEIEIRRVDEVRVAKVTKLKNGKDGGEYPFRLQVVPIGMDDDGDVIESCVVVHTDDAPRKREQPSGEWQHKVWAKVADLSGPGCNPIEESKLIDAVIAGEPESERPRRSVVRQGIDGLAKKGLLVRAAGRLEIVSGEA